MCEARGKFWELDLSLSPRASNPKEHSLQLTCELMVDLRLNITLRTDLDLSRNITIDSVINYVLKKI